MLKIDIKGYYPNMGHDFAERMLKEYLDNETHEMAVRALGHLPGEVGYNPGSQIVQIVGIAALDKIDHYIKERLRVKCYIRYMDDFILLHEDRTFLERCLAEICSLLEAQHMKANKEKTSISRISEPIRHLGFVYRLTPTGKVVVLADPKKVKHERKKILRMVELVKRGEMAKVEVDAHFKTYKASVRYGCSHNLIRRLNQWYAGLWEGATA